jgi:hypothetical protein
LAAAAEARLQSEAVPLALQAIEEILRDEATPAAVKAKLALGVLDRARPPEDKKPDAGKSLNDMTISELESFATRLAASTPGQGEMLNVTPDKRESVVRTPDQSRG